MNTLSWWRRNAIWLVGLLGLTGFSAVTKVLNQYRFFIYPDSYYYLLLARNLLSNHHPTGTLGVAGMAFPPPGYAAMKVVYPVLIAAALALRLPAEQAGHWASSVCSVLAVPAAYAAVWRLIRSKPAALTGAALVATSYGLTYWSGFVMSDSASVLLAFCLLWAIAQARPDELSNPGDIAAGVLASLLLMSRPTYVVALPLILWLGFRSWGWTWKRLATAAVACVLPAGVVSAVWFPPASFTLGVVGRLAPVIAASALAAIVAAGAWWLLSSSGDATGDDPAPGDNAMRGSRTADIAYYLFAAVPLLAFLIQRGFVLVAGAGPFLAVDRFVPRDAATVVFVLTGAIALDLARRRDVGVALLGSAVIMLGVYFWAESRDSRYLVHLLPLLVPVASATVLLPRQPRLARWASLGAIVALLLVMGVQGARGLVHAEAPFLSTDYPTEVAARLALPSDSGMLVSAQPWAYNLRTGLPSWSADATSIAQFTSYVPSDSRALLLADAPLRAQYPQLAAAAAKRYGSRVVSRFDVEVRYLYGYSGIADSGPVELYDLTAGELRALSAATSETPAAAVQPPDVR